LQQAGRKQRRLVAEMCPKIAKMLFMFQDR
jgi:hypothetical protein